MEKLKQPKGIAVIMISVMAVVAMCALIFGIVAGADSTFYDFGDGSGKVEAVRISNESELKAFAQSINDGTATVKNAILTEDITLTPPAEGDSNFIPIGTETNKFIGKFDGQGHKIIGIVINNSNQYQGLFGFAGVNSLIKNVGVTGGSITGYQ